MESLKQQAIKLGATDLKVSTRKGKKYMVKYDNKWIHFGASGYQDYTTHKDEKRRANYRARHSKIKLKDGRLAYKVKTQASYWSYNLTW
jgi:hypothetical protein